ncbi:uncharacterized protein LOC125834055 [Solanum verrucosum]|uniref:uncharacterized protein LOC125834055 n=1 Tax=Solanum verrucosum TaxID=315347 RepID=UPI0020D1D9C1|nr:uncharacterized protein LOC125834055 [Solanum verrucosum]
MSSGVDVRVSKDNDVIEVNEEPENATEKEAEITPKVVPCLDLHLPSHKEALEQMPGYAKFMKDLVTKKRAISFEDDDKLQHFSAIATRSLCRRRKILGISLFLVPLGWYIFQRHCAIWKPIGVLQDILVKVEPFIFPVDFVILDCDVDFEVSIILGRPFLVTGRALVDMEKGQMKLRLNNEESTFNISRSMKQSIELKSVSMVTHIVESGFEVPIKERLGVDALTAVMMNFDGDGIEDYDELVAALDRLEIPSKPKRLELDMKNRDSPPFRPCVEEAPKLELKALPSHLRYAFFGRDGTLRVIIAANFNVA